MNNHKSSKKDIIIVSLVLFLCSKNGSVSDASSIFNIKTTNKPLIGFDAEMIAEKKNSYLLDIDEETAEDQEDEGKLYEIGIIPEQLQIKGDYCSINYSLGDISTYNSTPELKLNDNELELTGEDGIYSWDNEESELGRGIDYHIVIDNSRNYKLDEYKALKGVLSGLDEEVYEEDTVTFYLTSGDNETSFFHKKYTVDDLESLNIADELDKADRIDENRLYERLNDVAEEISSENDQFNLNGIDQISDARDAFSEINRPVIIVFSTGYDSAEDYIENRNQTKSKWDDYGIPLYTVILTSYSDDIIEDGIEGKVKKQTEDFISFSKSTGGKVFLFGEAKDNEEILSGFSSDDYMTDISTLTDYLESDIYVSYFRLPDSYDISTSEYINADFSIIDESDWGDKTEYVYVQKRVKNTSYLDAGYNRPETTEEDSRDNNKTEELSELDDSTNDQFTREYDVATNQDAGSNEKRNKGFTGFIKEYWLIVLVAFVLVVILITLLAVIHFRKKAVKKNRDGMKLNVSHHEKGRISDNNNSNLSTIRPAAIDKTGVPVSLSILSGGSEEREKTVYINGSAIVGRGTGCDIFIDDGTLSRQHFVIEYTRGEFYIQDLETTNGTFLNGIKVTHRRRIEKGDVLRAGDLEMIIRW